MGPYGCSRAVPQGNQAGMESGKKVMIIAGEASGDNHGARLVKAMLELDKELFFFGIGGHAMKQAGVDIRVDYATMAVVGLSEAFIKLGSLLKAFRIAKKDLRNRRPDLLIVIDFPDFNLHVATAAKKLGVPVLYYISPQIWAWRIGRLNKIRKVVDHMIVIFPFEEEFYRRAHVPVTFVGHPLLDHTPPPPASNHTKGADTGGLTIGCLPGSRNEEVRRLLPVMVKASEIISRQVSDPQFVIPLAPSVDKRMVESILAETSCTFHVLSNRLHEVLNQSILLITASGTVTLEAALAGTPMIIIYKVSGLSYRIGKHLICVKHIGLPNLIAGKAIVPELIQHEASAENIARHAVALLRNATARKEMHRQLIRTAQTLGSPGASKRAAKIALSMLSLTKKSCGV